MLKSILKISMDGIFSVLGTSTDGEFEQLRRRGETRPLHFWQLAHDARDSVSKMSKNTLLQMLEMRGGNDYLFCCWLITTMIWFVLVHLLCAQREEGEGWGRGMNIQF